MKACTYSGSFWRRVPTPGLHKANKKNEKCYCIRKMEQLVAQERETEPLARYGQVTCTVTVQQSVGCLSENGTQALSLSDYGSSRAPHLVTACMRQIPDSNPN
ncbi:hypothetical protein GJAV_G00011340 [Gymnothorax javanicus]|nr:hypothetical protein GJAV_G00011340 [Gymnothorax javanicus]